MSSIIQVEDKSGVLVVDSRLIAAELGITHKNFLATIDKYRGEIEEAFGTLAFETREFKTSKGNTSEERYAFLNEEQSHYLMTLSRNTEQVRQCKRNLVKAFSEAKKIIPGQQQEIEKLKLELQLAQTQQKLLSTAQLLEAVSPGLAPLALGKSDSMVTRVEIVEKHATVDERGRTVAETTGASRTEVAKSLGMKKAKDLNSWLLSIGREDLLETGVRIVSCEYIPLDSIEEIRKLWVQQNGDRQRLIGEL